MPCGGSVLTDTFTFEKVVLNLVLVAVKPIRCTLQLIKTLRTIGFLHFISNDGKIWKFQVQWSCSVPTYIKRSNNWRQVHWLTKKVLAGSDQETTFEELLGLFSHTWYSEQIEWDQKLDHEKYVWTDKIFSGVLDTELVPKNSTVFVYTPRESSPYLHVNSHLLAEKFTCNVWNVETQPYYYRTSLTKANNRKDQRVRFGWNESLASSIEYWTQRDASFDILVATELLATNTSEQIKKIAHIMNSEARVFFLEPVDQINEEQIKQELLEAGFQNIQIKDVTEESMIAQNEFFEVHKQVAQPVESKWLFIHATV
uniref:phosphoethanolamine N-methyltransferase n=1 Tax=Heterorhabditis bacteriophora TaxID=37862 RepID=A0A1I7XI21_HETBA